MKSTYYTVTEVAKMLKLSPITIMKMIREGKLQGLKVSRMWRIDSNSLEQFLNKARDTSHITNMSDMFKNCSNKDFGKFDTSKIESRKGE